MSNYNQAAIANGVTRFTKAPVGDLERSKMVTNPRVITAFNAGEIVPIDCFEVLPSQNMSVDLDFVLRQSTLLTPTMGQMECDFYAFFVPNRVVNSGFKSVMRENVSGSWIAPEVALAPLYNETSAVKVPVGSVADYYGMPTQGKIPAAILQGMHDLKFRGYVEIYNQYFRDQNYQAPIPYSKLNVYNGFLGNVGDSVGLTGAAALALPQSAVGDNSYGAGAVKAAVYGDGDPVLGTSSTQLGMLYPRKLGFSALAKPLRANKKHDYFTSVLPAPQKSADVVLNFAGTAPVYPAAENNPIPTAGWNFAKFVRAPGGEAPVPGGLTISGTDGNLAGTDNIADLPNFNLAISNLVTDLSQASAFDISQFRMAASIQKVYEQLARAGSRYREFVNAFFGIEADDPYSDIPRLLGRVNRSLDLFQTAQTSASQAGSTPQGSLAAFGYTATGGNFFNATFLEHGYVHILAVVRQRNVYPALLDRDWFRLNFLDYYTPQLANISEQPVYSYQINACNADNVDQVFGYQEAWAEYRYDFDKTTGAMRPGISESLAVWNYADDYEPDLQIADADWLQSNAQAVLDRTLAVTSEQAPQLLLLASFRIAKELPMPIYSVPGLDIV